MCHVTGLSKRKISARTKDIARTCVGHGQFKKVQATGLNKKNTMYVLGMDYLKIK
jgi:hypothetical protein